MTGPRRLGRLALSIDAFMMAMVAADTKPAYAGFNCWGCALSCDYGQAVHACINYCWGWSPTGQCAYVPEFCPGRAIECRNPSPE